MIFMISSFPINATSVPASCDQRNNITNKCQFSMLDINLSFSKQPSLPHSYNFLLDRFSTPPSLNSVHDSYTHPQLLHERLFPQAEPAVIQHHAVEKCPCAESRNHSQLIFEMRSYVKENVSSLLAPTCYMLSMIESLLSSGTTF